MWSKFILLQAASCTEPLLIGSEDVLPPVATGDTHVIDLLLLLPARAGCSPLSRPLPHKDINIRALMSDLPSVRDFSPSLLMEEKK